jgi:hypothetical protein
MNKVRLEKLPRPKLNYIKIAERLYKDMMLEHLTIDDVHNIGEIIVGAYERGRTG